MRKIILITGSTDGIGLAAARLFAESGHHLLMHGRNPSKLGEAVREIRALVGGGGVESYTADLSRLDDVDALATEVTATHTRLDVLINNAGVFATPDPATPSGLDVRFVVNTIAPYVLTQRLMGLLGATGRVINLSSAAQSPVSLEALAGKLELADGPAYAQSKLALTMWSRSMALSLGGGGPAIIAVNPGSMLGTKMVAEAYGVAGADVGVGADVLFRAALADEFAAASGRYFDNDSGGFAPPHQDALDAEKTNEVVRSIEAILARHRAL